MFIARYSAPELRVEDVDRERILRLMEVFPKSIRSTKFPPEIARVSPRFVEIFGQAEHSEVLGLVDVAGPGYRKAFEHLIKDYASSKSPEKSAEIKKLALAQCVTNYLRDPRVRQCAERAVWLGNDETHYERKWIGKDLQDLLVDGRFDPHGRPAVGPGAGRPEGTQERRSLRGCQLQPGGDSQRGRG